MIVAVGAPRGRRPHDPLLDDAVRRRELPALCRLASPELIDADDQPLARRKYGFISLIDSNKLKWLCALKGRGRASRPTCA